MTYVGFLMIVFQIYANMQINSAVMPDRVREGMHENYLGMVDYCGAILTEHM